MLLSNNQIVSGYAQADDKLCFLYNLHYGIITIDYLYAVMPKRLFVLLILCSAGNALFASGYHFRYTEHCAAAYTHFMALQTSKGKTALQQAHREDPNNLLAVYIADYEDFFLLLLNGDPADMGQRRQHLYERIRLLDKADQNDPHYRLCKAGIYLHWAIVYGRFGEQFKAALTFRKAYVLIRENKKLFPAFAPNNVFYGLCEAVAGAVPDEHKWLAAIFGVKGDVNKGVSRILHYINNNPDPNTFLKTEAIIAWCYLKFYLQARKEPVWNFIHSNRFPVQQNLLNAFVKANIALNYRKADIALQTLRRAENIPEYKLYPVFDYEMGIALYHKLDPTCIRYFAHYIHHHKSKFYIKDAWHMTALTWYLQGNADKANTSREQINNAGSRVTDADRQAQRFAEEKKWPHPQLLKAQLLCDGGYYTEALQTLHTITPATFSNTADSAAYHFRLGRIYDETGEDSLALVAYRQTTQIGKNRKEHFAARAALQMGLIYEQQGKIIQAIAAFRECLSMKGHDFQASIDQQAKAGINRLGG